MSKKPIAKPIVAADVKTAPVAMKPEVVKSASPAAKAAAPVVKSVAAPAKAPAVEPKVAVKTASAAPLAAPMIAPKVAAAVADVQAQIQDVATKTITEAKSGFQKISKETAQAGSAVEASLSTVTKAMADLNAKIFDALRSNSEATLDVVKAAFAVKTPSELVELQMKHVRKQLEVFGAQAQEISTAATKIAQDASQPLKAQMQKARAL